MSESLLPFLIGRVNRLEKQAADYREQIQDQINAFQSFNQAILRRLDYLESITSCSSVNSPGFTLTPSARPGFQIGYMANMSFTPSPYLPNKENR